MSLIQYVGSKRPLSAAKGAAQIQKALDAAVKPIEARFLRHVRYYDSGPKITKQKVSDAERVIGTESDDVHRVDVGVRAHRITATGRALAFRSNYAPKTAVNAIDSRPGGASGDLIFTNEVDHPGFPARNVDETIAADAQAEVEAIFAQFITDLEG